MIKDIIRPKDATHYKASPGRIIDGGLTSVYIAWYRKSADPRVGNWLIYYSGKDSKNWSWERVEDYYRNWNEEGLKPID